jgi:hypothetical protein
MGGICQDANDCRVYVSLNGEKVFAAAVADGAGSALRGGDGAVTACRVLLSLVDDHLRSGSSVAEISLETARSWIHGIQDALRKEAESASLDPREFACTLLGFVAGQSCTVCLQIGDGVIVVADSEEHTYGHVFWPDRGEYANTTHFVTEDEVEAHLQFESVQREIVEAALLTDGLQGVALNYQQHAAHGPFFRGLFAPLSAAGEGPCDDLSRSLREFLSSPRVNEKTDDDKTLVLASRVNGSLGAYPG